MRIRKETIIWFVYCFVIFMSLYIFFVRIRPQILFNTDDWTYLSFTRTSKLLPSTREWNPAKVLPENLMPISGYLGKLIYSPFVKSFYNAVTSGMSLVLCLFVLCYIMLTVRMIGDKFELNVYERMILGLFIILIHFTAFPFQKERNYHFFYETNPTNVFNYTIPCLLNMILVSLSVIHESYLRKIFDKEHIVCKTIYAILLYFAVYSNLYSSVIIAVFAGVKIIQYLFVEVRDYTTDWVDKLIQCTVYIYVLLLWFVSMIFESKGGRANQLSGSSFDLKSSFQQLIGAMKAKSVIYNLMIVASIVFCFVVLIYVCRNKDRYLKPLLSKHKSTSKKEREAVHEKTIDTYCFSYINWAVLWVTCAVLTMLFIVLLCAKTGGGYHSYASVQFDYNYYLMLNLFMILAFLIKINRKFVYGVGALAVLMGCLIAFSDISYAEYNGFWQPGESCHALADYIVEQYVEADRSGVETAQIHVPDFGTEDNFPIANYGNMRIANTLYNYGVTSRFVMSEFVIDGSVNERFGM